ncbi:outer membrane beta-barrel protein [Marivita sp. GX14005]|uniref:outer membrane protein n=1 Tax=Marivita sp. GX14005 TaxID=2942276 RepID=UPI002018B241|nr:outer membrane beta-barrel protein [Marivita sp. GX14005]MCL3883746.1 outer membrane beta-barrel protein [Marivita sp. GX14005]
MKKILLSTAFIASAATATYAGSAGEPVVEPVVVEPVAVAPMLGGDWTGFYGGLSLGQAWVDADDDLDDSEMVYGVHGGYDYDFGRFVLGGELDYQTGEDLNLGGEDIDDIVRLKMRAGYDLDRTLVYGVLGAAQLNTDNFDDTGWVAGIGAEYLVTDNVSLGAEYLYHQFDDFDDTNLDIDADTLSLRANFRF